MYGDLWLKNAGLLALFTLPALALGVVLGPSLLRVNAFFDRELQRTELILCERGSLSEERIAPDPSALERQYRRRKRESFLLMGLSLFLFLLAQIPYRSWRRLLYGSRFWPDGRVSDPAGVPS